MLSHFYTRIQKRNLCAKGFSTNLSRSKFTKSRIFCWQLPSSAYQYAIAWGTCQLQHSRKNPCELCKTTKWTCNYVKEFNQGRRIKKLKYKLKICKQNLIIYQGFRYRRVSYWNTVPNNSYGVSWFLIT